MQCLYAHGMPLIYMEGYGLVGLGTILVVMMQKCWKGGIEDETKQTKQIEMKFTRHTRPFVLKYDSLLHARNQQDCCGP